MLLVLLPSLAFVDACSTKAMEAAWKQDCKDFPLIIPSLYQSNHESDAEEGGLPQRDRAFK